MAGILGQINQNAQGLGNTAIQQMEMQQVQRQNQMQDDAMNYLQQYQQSVQAGKPDNNLLYSGVLKSPQLASGVLGAIGIVDTQQKTGAANDIVTGIAATKNKDKKSMLQWGAKRIADIKARGGNAEDTQEIMKMVLADDWDGVSNSLMTVGAALANEGYIKPELIGIGASNDMPNSQQEFEYYQRLQQQNPKLAEQFARARGYIETGREQSLSDAQKDWQTYQTLNKSNPEAAIQFGQKVGFVSKEGRELPAQLQRRLSEFTDAATTAATNVVKYQDLASQFDQGVQGGVIEGSWGEYFKDLTGNQDWKTELRKDFAQVRASEVVRNLPPGAASDVDIAMALEPFPSDNASGEQVASFLRGLSKLSEYNEKFSAFKANYISEKGTERGMVDAWKQFAKENEVKPVTPTRTLGKPVQVGNYSVVEVQ